MLGTHAGLVDEAKRIHLVCCPEDANPIVLGARAVETKRAQPGSQSEQWASCGCSGGLCTGDNALLAPFKVGVYSDGYYASKMPCQVGKDIDVPSRTFRRYRLPGIWCRVSA
jgi:hypothetical protein